MAVLLLACCNVDKNHSVSRFEEQSLFKLAVYEDIFETQDDVSISDFYASVFNI